MEITDRGITDRGTYHLSGFAMLVSAKVEI